MFTCISCRVAFETAAEQRSHFATDWHRYNMKRRVASLPPVAADHFNEKVIERREQNAVKTDPRSLDCAACNKNFSSENAYRSHVQSKKHRDKEQAQLSTIREDPEAQRARPYTSSSTSIQDDQVLTPEAGGTQPTRSVSIQVDVDSEDDEEMDDEDLDAKIAGFRRRLQPSDCLFCTKQSASVDQNVSHMARLHSFFIPDRDILIDLPGLLSYLGEKVATGNLCLFCPNGGREFGSLEAVRKHMKDKAHCKIAYTTDEDRAEIADYYDFSGSDHSDNGSEWEDIDETEEQADSSTLLRSLSRSRLPELAPDGFGLVLPSGRTIGHKSLRVYYDQRLRPAFDSSHQDTKALKLSQVRQRLADPTLALVPMAGGHGAYGRGLEVFKARNAGEAKWAKKQGNLFKDQKKLNDLRTRVGFVHNNQKHFRDPLLQ